MIQRIQSILLVLVIASLISSVVFPLGLKANEELKEVAEMSAKETVVKKLVDGEEKVLETKGHIYLFILPLLAAGVALFSLFQYKNRLRQMQLGALNSLIMAGSLGLIVFKYVDLGELIPVTTHETPLFGFWALAAAMIFNLSANRFIRKDEKLVKSMDRIR